ncbi:MAG: endolytic transglycosylase MltG [Betaproteobacteria bacterium]|nr:endolytic transglycosylase MltG [Betaproteobacteria bacterium]
MPFSTPRFLRALLSLAIAGIVAACAYGAWYAITPVPASPLPIEFEVPAGSSLRAAVRLLEEAGLVVRPLHFELLARATGRANAIKAGNYEITAPISPEELLEKLTRGAVMQADLRIIEGWSVRQLRAALDASPFLRHETAGQSDAEVLARVGAKQSHPEGLFFPDTYLFARGSSDLAVLRRAHRAMQRHLAEEWEQRAAEAPYKTPYEALVMASIVEKETGRAEERDQIAGVLVNRLRIGMALQADPTVIYGLGKDFDGNLKRAHLITDGPYNTYTRPGLPPTPIALPGLASLRAALRPAQTKALYYVSRGDGSSHFSRNLEEHNRAVSKYQLQPRRK